jgi:hypothetical protein
VTKEDITIEEVKMYLANSYEGGMVFHVAANFYTLEVFQGIFNLAKDNKKSGGE